MIGLNRFIMVVRMDNLTNYSQNHYEILDPFNKNVLGKTVREIGTIATRPFSDICGKYYNTISDYNIFTLDQNLKIFRRNSLFVPENMQFVILLNKNIDFPERILYDIINVRIVAYLKDRMPEFVNAMTEALYQNIKYDGFSYDPLNNLSS